MFNQNNTIMPETKKYFGMGWVRDYPDFRDYSPERDAITDARKKMGEKMTIQKMLKQAGLNEKKQATEKDKIDLCHWCSPIEDQESIGSCTANAGAGLLEFFEKRAFGKYTDASRLFLYKTTRNLMKLKGDTGAYLRTTMQAMRLFGVLPEEYWEYDIDKYDEEPPSFCYSYAQNYQSINFYRLDGNGIKGEALLERIRWFLNANLPSMFGFTVFRSIAQANETGAIPFPGFNDKVAGGHAVMAVGYDNKKKIKNMWDSQTLETVGAIKIRNSWGKNWGEHGYGWLPYEYIRQGLAVDWWSLIDNEWVDSDRFKEV